MDHDETREFYVGGVGPNPKGITVLGPYQLGEIGPYVRAVRKLREVHKHPDIFRVNAKSTEEAKKLLLPGKHR